MYALTTRLVSKKDLDELAGSIHTGCLAFIKEAEQITRKMDRLQMAEKKFRHSDVPGEVRISSVLRKLFRV
jgi:hypothetical protein